MACLIDRFNVISNFTETNEITFEDYIRNYMDNNIICNPILIKTKFNENTLNMFLRNYTREIKSNYIRINKHCNKTSIKIIYDNMIDFESKIKILLNKFNSPNKEIINKTLNIYFDIIITSPFMNSIYNNAFINNIDIKPFFSYLLQHFDNEKYNDCLIMFKNVIEKNIPDINISNYKYKDILYIKKLFEYTFEVINRYGKMFNIELILEPLYIKINKSIENIIRQNNSEFIINFLKVFSNEFIKICSNYSKLSNIIYSIKINDIDSLISIIKIIEQIEIIKLQTHIIKEYILYHKHLCEEEKIKKLAFISIDNIKKKINNKYIYLIVSSFEKNTDLFFSIIEMFLKKRIIYCGSTYDEEIEEFNILSKYFKPSTYYKYHKIINDIKMNKNITMNGYNTKFIYISDNIWDINTNDGYHILNNKKLYLHLGKANATLTNAVKSYNINCLPIHIDIIQLIISNKYKINGNFHYYSDDFISSIENQLLDSNIIKLSNDGYIINDYYDGGDLDLIEEYFNRNMKKIIQNVIEELAHDRKHILMANINSIYKKNQENNFNEIYHMIKEKIKLFDFDYEYYNSVIKEMEEKEYI
jgi:hypothetical protein